MPNKIANEGERKFGKGGIAERDIVWLFCKDNLRPVFSDNLSEKRMVATQGSAAALEDFPKAGIVFLKFGDEGMPQEIGRASCRERV